ncbi:MAG: tRNA lysidine(34) synthetase TilS [Pyramidobacter sp.]|jgi:tRNA(Ile)-lysidine synthase
MSKDEVLRRFRSVLEERGWIDETPVLLGVSGGSDSMSLLYLYWMTVGASNVAVVHMNHGLRPTAERDADFVRGRCHELGVRCAVLKRDVNALARKGESSEAAGRRLRYGIYDEFRRLWGCRLVALGHTRNDLAENVVMNLARGCGLRGLAGMPRQRGVYIRPLLGFYRDELRAFLCAHQWIWVDDETNEEDRYQRNRVRHRVMPVLAEQVNSKAVEHLAALAEEALLWRETQELRLERCFLGAQSFDSLWPAMKLKELRRLDDYQRPELLRWMGRKLGLAALPRRRAIELDRLVKTSGRWIFQWGSEVDVTAAGGELRFHPASEKRSASVPLRMGESLRWGGWQVSLLCEKTAAGQNYGFSFAVDPHAPVILTKNENSAVFNDPFPKIEQKEKILAERTGNGWEFPADSVKYTGVAQILFVPLKGMWRNSLWNTALTKC